MKVNEPEKQNISRISLVLKAIYFLIRINEHKKGEEAEVKRLPAKCIFTKPTDNDEHV